LLLAATLVTAAGTIPAFAVENRGLVHRVGKMEVVIFGVQHKERPLHDRITQLEAHTLGAGNTGPLTQRLDSLEKVVNGEAGARSASSTGIASNSPVSRKVSDSTKTGSHSKSSSGGKNKFASRGKAPTGHALANRGNSLTQSKAVGRTDSVMLPPVAPRLDPGPEPSVAPTILERATATGTQTSSDSIVTASPPLSDRQLGQDLPAVEPTGQQSLSSVDEMIRKGTIAHRAGNTEEAEKVFKEALVKSPFNSNACFNLGAIAEGRGDLASALGNYRTALIGTPNDLEIQQAIAQVESQIAQKQDSPFKNPLVTTSGATPLLQGNASEFDPLSGQRISQTPVAAPVAQRQSQRGSAWRTAGAVGANLFAGVARGAIRGAISGGGSGALSGAISSGGRSALGAAFRAPARGGSPGSMAAGMIMNSLHCPICRILP